MGFSSVASHLIMFISALSVATALVMSFSAYADETSAALTIKREAMTNSIRTDATITNVLHNSTSNQTTIHILNTGDTELKINFTDVIMGGYLIARDNNKTLDIVPSTVVRNPLLWDPNEVLEIIVNKTLVASQVYALDVITQYGVKVTETFST